MSRTYKPYVNNTLYNCEENQIGLITMMSLQIGIPVIVMMR